MRTPEAFAAAVANVLAWEGGYVNDPDDPGGETNFGISKRFYPSVDIRGLTRAGAIAIYRRDWWDKNRIGDFPDPIAIKMLDIAVNMGWSAAVKVLQRACNHAGPAHPIAVDGSCGPITRKTVHDLYATVPNLLGILRIEDANRYREIAASNPVMAKYLRGWLRRAAS
jgi:lysozyme family protein